MSNLGVYWPYLLGRIGLSAVSLVLAAFLFCGCSTPSDLPNFAVVDKGMGVYRSGQPTKAGFEILRTRYGVTNVIKLNLDSEGIDRLAPDQVEEYIPITLAEQLFKTPAWKIESAVADVTPGTLVHCSHGEDRTGVVVACWHLENGWSWVACSKEMDAHNFHHTLFGLDRYWEAQK